MTQQAFAATDQYQAPEPAGTDTLTRPTTVGVVGLGYVGLPTAVALTTSRVGVVGIDVNATRISAIRNLDVDMSAHDRVRLAEMLGSGSYTMSDDVALLAGVDGIVICVPTPVDEHLTPDLTALRAACDSVVSVARPGQIIVLTSTSYVGTTTDLLVEPLERKGLRVGIDVFVAFSPERIDPGSTTFEHNEVPRVVGGKSRECTKRAVELVKLMTTKVHEVSSPEAAELTKLYENTFRAVNIALINEIADVSAALAVPIVEVIDAAATKPFGFMPFAPGPGVGGHCIPCDPHYLLWQLRSKRLTMPLVESAMQGIAARPAYLVSRAREVLAEAGVPIRGARILVAGVAYKPAVSDVRESPALEIISRLRRLGAEVCYVDPYVASLTIDGQTIAASAPAEVEAVDLAILHTRHPGHDLRWLDCVPRVLDATYRAFDVANRLAV